MSMVRTLDSQDLIMSRYSPMGWLRIFDPYTGHYPRAHLLAEYKLKVEYTFLGLPGQNEAMVI